MVGQGRKCVGGVSPGNHYCVMAPPQSLTSLSTGVPVPADAKKSAPGSTTIGSAKYLLGYGVERRSYPLYGTTMQIV